MKTVFQKVAVLLTLVLISGFGLVNHVAAMPSTMPQMNGSMEHSQSAKSSPGCITLCTNVVFNKDDLQNPILDEDDEPIVPFYVQSQDQLFSDTLVKQKLYADTVKPPPKIPIYILYDVFRV